MTATTPTRPQTQPFMVRYYILGAIFTLMGVLVIGQMARIQNSVIAGELRQQAEHLFTPSKLVYPERGSIYDRWGHLLAGNETVYELGLNLAEVSDPETIAANVSAITGADYNELKGKASTKYVEGQQIYVTLVDFVTTDQAAQLQNMQKHLAETAAEPRRGQVRQNMDGLTYTPHLKRTYPERTLASNVLGFYNYKDRTGGQGFLGVEQKYNDLLSGSPQWVNVPLDPTQAENLPEVPPGASLVLTIDREIQASVEHILDNALNETGADSGTIIVMDPETGELLAMATSERMDLNQYWTYADLYGDGRPFNRAVDTTYEPGSVFKVLTMASALDKGTVTPDTSFTDTGVIEVGGAYITNWNGGGWGPVDMTGCMQHSLNVCLAWIAVQMGPTDFYQYVQSFGIGQPTGIDLAGESVYPLRLPGDSNWMLMDLGTNSFGQGVAVTPIQMITAISAVANDGKMMAPHIVRSMIDGGRQYNTTPTVLAQPISAEAAHTLTTMLARSLEEEAQEDITVEGYRMAGKTGTAEIPGPTGYSSDLTNASFAGWGPVDDPKFVVYVWLEKPETSIWGSVVAAPVFADVARSLVVLMDIPPDDVRQMMNPQ